MAALTGQAVQDSFKDLLQVSNANAGIDGTLRNVSDGEATSCPLQLSSAAVNIASGFQLNGTAAQTGALLKHEVGGIEANISAITTDQFLGGTGAGAIGIRTATQVRTSLGLATGDTVQLGKLGIGAALTDGTLHVISGSAGAVSANVSLDEGVFEGSGEAGISVLGPDANQQQIGLGSVSDNLAARIRWKFDDLIMTVGTITTNGDLQLTAGNNDVCMLFDGGATTATSDYKWNLQSGLFVNETAHANATTAIVVNQDTADDIILALKSSDVAHALTAPSTQVTQETDDWFTIQKRGGSFGGAHITVTTEDAAANPSCQYDVRGGTASTADTTTSFGLFNITVAEHDGANALIDAPANQNIFSIQAQVGGSLTTALLLKGDDGELHLGNSTVVALDSEDDIHAVRSLQRYKTRGKGIVETPYDRPAYDYRALRRMGVVGPKDKHGNFLISVQGHLGLHDGAFWQLYCDIQEMREKLARLETIAQRARLQ